MAHEQNLEIVCGNDVAVPVTLYSGDTGTTALNLTGASAIAYVVRRQAGQSAVLTLSVANSKISVTSASDGELTMTFADTDTLPAEGERLVGVFDHEMLVTDASGNKSTVFKGRLTILPTVAA